MEEYEFKANIALSLLGFREVLREEIPEEEQEKVGEFVIQTLDKIYQNPMAKNSDQSAENSNSQDNMIYTGSAQTLVDTINRLRKQDSRVTH